MPSTIGKCKLFRIKHIILLEGETFLRNKHEIAFFEIKCTFSSGKENTNRVCQKSAESSVASNFFLTFYSWGKKTFFYKKKLVFYKKNLLSTKKNLFSTKKILVSTEVSTFLMETPEIGALYWCFFATFARN